MSRGLVAALVVALTLVPAAAEAQVTPPEPEVTEPETPPDSVDVVAAEPDDPAEPTGPSPGGAFLRSLILPGWGQAAYDANFRGAVFFGMQTGGWFMIAKTVARLGEARDMEERRVAAIGGMVRDSLLLAAEENTNLADRYQNDPLALERDVVAGVDADESVQEIRSLVNARRQQREDWITLTLFLTLASGIDAFVNAHLSDFPARVIAEPSGDGGVSIGLRIPVAGRR